MSTPLPAKLDPIRKLNARLDRLALDPRVRLLKDGAEIVFELRALLADLEHWGPALGELDRRVGALEGAMAVMVPRPEEFE